MKTLEEYLAGDFRGDSQEIERLSRALEQAAWTFKASFQEDYWPYQYKTDGTHSGKKSQGTLAMVLCATGKLLGKCRVQGRTEIINDNQLAAHWEVAISALTNGVDPAPSPSSKKGSKPTPDGGFQSTTFGTDNAMTLSHIAELEAALVSHESLAARVKPKLEIAIGKLATEIANSIEAPLLFPDHDTGIYRPSGFILLRLLRACRDVGEEGPVGQLRKYFESGLHDQLSFSAIPDSRFDPAEMLFCLEGLLVCAPEAVDGAAFQRILEVLAEKQNTSAHWRPNKPFLSSDRGAIMLPLSIECANSLLRSVAIIDKHRTHDMFGSRTLPLLHRFWSWLEARTVTFTPTNGPAKGQRCVGWHSEHINEPDLIHIWDTSQVVEFMIGYRALLLKHVARTTLDLSGVLERKPKPLRRSLPIKRDATGKEIEGATYGWDEVVADREPLKDNSKQQIFADVGKYFVDPRCNPPKGKPAYSMLLFGPPGTGKSSLAELMADTLGWSMLTVTVSDFLGSGGAMVEARAKAIFQMLEAQSDVVILFDEIDSFLLDRDSEFYRKQETLFQFLTPGMLTKINDLRKAKRSIFIIATNYANRIDPAIKRIGRIDHKFLLLPPNLERRLRMIEKAWGEENEKRAEKGKDPIAIPEPAEIIEAAKAAYFLGWNDIQGAVKAKIDDAKLDLTLELSKAERSTGANFYGRRFPVEKPFVDQIRDETRWLYTLADEAGKKSDFEERFKASASSAYTGDEAGAKSLEDQVDKMLQDIKESDFK